MSGKFKSWIQQRIPLDAQKTSALMEKIFLKEPIPKHMKYWYYTLGATPLILFLIMVFTGILLTFYYIPSPAKAYESIAYITGEVSMGFWIRGIHRWGSNLMVIAIFLHMVRVFFTRGYRKPREINWVIGVLMLLVTLTICFTGYSLVYNQLSYWATTVGTNMIKEIPLIGAPILYLLRGGEDVTANTLTRFFNLHIGFLPTILLILIVLHIIFIRMHGVAKLEDKEDEETYSFYPEHFYHTLIVGLFLLAVLSALTVIMPPGLGEQANANVTPSHIKPEWYFFAVYSVLKYVPLKFGIYFFTALIIVLTFWPFLDDFIRRKWQVKKIHYWVGSLTIVLFLFLTVFEIIVQ